MLRLLRFGLLCAVCTCAVPPLRPAARLAASTHVVTGPVIELNTSLQNDRHEPAGADDEWVDRAYSATIEIDAVEVGPLERGARETFHCWRRERRPKGMVGPQGQQEELLLGQRVRVFAGGDMHLLTPNGFEALAEEPKPPRLVHSRRHGLQGDVELRRDIGVDECPWLEQPLRKGERLRVFTGHTYGAVGPRGVAVVHRGVEDGPFFEVPADAVSPLQ